MDNFIGQYYDVNVGSLVDVKGIGYNQMVQFDAYGDSQSQSLLLASMVADDVLNSILLNDTTCGRFQLFDFTGGVDNPVAMGVVKILDVSGINSLSASNKNNDYTSIIRTEFDVIQTVVPQQQFVDLSKWIKVTQTIHI
jgi:hypothetical protein